MKFPTFQKQRLSLIFLDSRGQPRFSSDSQRSMRHTKRAGLSPQQMDQAHTPAVTLAGLPLECRLLHFEKNELPFLWATEYSRVTPDSRADNRHACQSPRGS